MGWDADFGEMSWNYTHNTNRMISTVLEEAGVFVNTHWLIGHMGGSWFDVLNGMTAQSGEKLLTTIIVGLEKEPARFREMNPPNGWGDYDGLLKVLKEMRTRSVQSGLLEERWRMNG